jgi:hypothetical protein
VTLNPSLSEAKERPIKSAIVFLLIPVFYFAKASDKVIADSQSIFGDNKPVTLLAGPIKN